MPIINTILSATIVKSLTGSGSMDRQTGEDKSQTSLLFSSQYPTSAFQPTPPTDIYLFLLCGQQTFSPCFWSHSRFRFGSSQLGHDQEACFPNGEKHQISENSLMFAHPLQAENHPSRLPAWCQLQTLAGRKKQRYPLYFCQGTRVAGLAETLPGPCRSARCAELLVLFSG